MTSSSSSVRRPAASLFLKRIHRLLLALCALVIGVGFFMIVRLVWPTFDTGTFQYEGRESHAFTAPMYGDGESSSFRADLPMLLGRFHPTRFVITPDDCLDFMNINGVRVNDIDQHICLDQHGVTVDLSKHLKEGRNDLTFSVKDFGGFGGISFSPSLADPLLLPLILGGILSLAVSVFCFLLFFGAGRKTRLLFLLLALGLALRVIIAPSQGYEFDIGVNQGWAKSAVMLGMAQSYTEQVDGTMLPNYPPFSLMVFTGVGHVYQWMDPGFDRFSPLYRIVIKFPAILADVLTALFLYLILKRTRNERTGLLSALVYLVHPAVIYDSAVWGQTDSIYTLLIVATLWGAMSKRWILSGLFTILAFFTKLQSIVVIPTIFFFFLRGRKPSLQLLFGGILGTLIVLVPFAIAGGIKPIVDVYLHTVGYYSSLSYGAYNIWQALFGSGAGGPDSALMFGVISFQKAGLLIFCLTTLLIVCLRGLQIASPEKQSRLPELPLLMTALIAYGFFLFNTEMHERYLFPLMALSLPLIFVSWRGVTLYILGSLLFWLNLMGVMPLGSIDRALFSTFPNFSSFIGAAHLFVYIGMFLLILDASRPPLSLRKRLDAAFRSLQAYAAKKGHS